ncbi:uncharacterized protein [Eurosta solidaginis]|uniref:uncharacterized protein n=1 Tax=Eurosta solidaginis TaxID=178769 RepID=UPI003530E5F7
MDQTTLQQGLSTRKEPEFIDHDLPLQSLLAPSYIRDSHTSNYIIDFMDSAPLVFPNKSIGNVIPGNSESSHTTASATVPTSGVGGGGGGYGMKVTDVVSLAPDLHFPSSIFHYRPTQNDVNVSNVASVAEAALNALNAPTQSTAPLPLVMSADRNSSSNGSGSVYAHEKHLHTDYLTLNSDFLDGGGSGGDNNKNFCDDTETGNQPNDDVAVQQFLLGSANVSLDDAADLIDASGDVLYTRHISNARKVLPHKKRISRKLRVSLSGGDNVLPPSLGDVHHKMPGPQRLSVPVIYSCEICGSTADSQLQFFAHLKQHYEPNTPDTILAAMKTSMAELEPQKLRENDKKCFKQSPSDSVDQVFNDVQLNFPDFSGVDETPMRHGMGPNDDVVNDLRVQNINSRMRYVTQNHSPPLKRTVEVEFSDSEDMLEGIRNVVDKVSIEDTCNALDLITSNAMRNTWFANDNFGAITYKNKTFHDDVTFTEPLPSMSMMASTSLTRRRQSREPTPLPPAEKLLSYQKADGRRDKLDIVLPPPVIDVDEDTDVVDEVVANRAATFYNDVLPPMRLPSVDDTGEHQLRCQTTQHLNAPNDLLQPLRLTQFQLSEDADGEISLDNAHLNEINIQQVNSNDLDGTVVAEAEVFCKEEPDAKDYDNGEQNEVCFDNVQNEVDYNEEEDNNAKEDKDANEYNNSNEENNNENSEINSQACPSPPRSSTPNGGDKKKHYCTICKREFNSHNAYKYHLHTHTGFRPHHCETCKKSFFALNALKAHQRTHTGDKPYKCEFCQRDFRQWADLRYHVTSKHTEDKNFQCEFCGKAFSRRYSLVLHRRIHTSERNFKCDQCSKTFRASIYLNEHRRIHTGEKPHECTVCSKKFRIHGDLRRHERIHERRESKFIAKIETSKNS